MLMNPPIGGDRDSFMRHNKYDLYSSLISCNSCIISVFIIYVFIYLFIDSVTCGINNYISPDFAQYSFVQC